LKKKKKKKKIKKKGGLRGGGGGGFLVNWEGFNMGFYGSPFSAPV